MKLDSFTERKQVNDAALAHVASKIRPLPQEVAPSPEFLNETRLRLLELEPVAMPALADSEDQQAA